MLLATTSLFALLSPAPDTDRVQEQTSGFVAQELNNCEIEIFPNDIRRAVVQVQANIAGDVTFTIHVDENVALRLGDDQGPGGDGPGTTWADLNDAFSIYQIQYTDLATNDPMVRVVRKYRSATGTVKTQELFPESPVDTLGSYDPSLPDPDPLYRVDPGGTVDGTPYDRISWYFKGVTLQFTVLGNLVP